MASKKKKPDAIASVLEFVQERVAEMRHLTDPMEQAAALVAAKRLEKRIDEVLTILKAAAEALGVTLAEHMKTSGATSLNVDDARVQVRGSVYINKVAGVDMEEACKALRAAKLGDLVGPSFNTSGLRAWFKERVDAADPGADLKSLLPKSIADLFNVHQEFKVSIVGA